MSVSKYSIKNNNTTIQQYSNLTIQQNSNLTIQQNEKSFLFVELRYLSKNS